MLKAMTSDSKSLPDSGRLHMTIKHTGIHNMAKSGGRKARPQGCSRRSHRLRRLKPLTPTFTPVTHSAMPSMPSCCSSELKRRVDPGRNWLCGRFGLLSDEAFRVSIEGVNVGRHMWAPVHDDI